MRALACAAFSNGFCLPGCCRLFFATSSISLLGGWSARPRKRLHKFRGPGEGFEIFAAQGGQVPRQLTGAAEPPLFQEKYTFHSSLQQWGATVGWIGPPGDEARPLERSDEPRHRRSLHLFRLGQRAERHGTAEDQHRKRRKAWAGQAAGRILTTQVAQEM